MSASSEEDSSSVACDLRVRGQSMQGILVERRFFFVFLLLLKCTSVEGDEPDADPNM